MQNNATSSMEEKKSGRALMSVIMASSVGTLIEWYDFYIYGTLASIIAKQFFPSGNETLGYLGALGTFAAGFIVRPFGALFFGRLGDLIGRKYTFLVTLLLMGLSTFAIGLIPNYNSIGIAAPILILVLRLLQGLALGGEYGGAATYVAEHAPDHRRGYYTGYIQTTATVGLLLSIIVILSSKSYFGDAAFDEYGWRAPFIISAIMIIISVYIRMKMAESPLFSKIKHSGKLSSNPLKESFAKKENLKMVLLALFGAVAGQGVIWYTGQFYAMSFLDKVCKVEFEAVRYILAVAIIAGTPLFLVFGHLSDKIGRKWIMLGGMFLGIISYQFIYSKMLSFSDTKITAITSVYESAPVKTEIDKEKGDTVTTFKVYKKLANGNSSEETRFERRNGTKIAEKDRNIVEVNKVYLSSHNWWMMVLMVFIQIVFVTMVYGPIAAFLVELFPTRIRYTSMSLPYHIGNGIFGGLVPYIATFLVESMGGNKLAGLYYPIGVALLTLIIGIIYLPSRTDKKSHDDHQ